MPHLQLHDQYEDVTRMPLLLGILLGFPVIGISISRIYMQLGVSWPKGGLANWRICPRTGDLHCLKYLSSLQFFYGEGSI